MQYVAALLLVVGHKSNKFVVPLKGLTFVYWKTRNHLTMRAIGWLLVRQACSHKSSELVSVYTNARRSQMLYCCGEFTLEQIGRNHVLRVVGHRLKESFVVVCSNV